MGFVLLFFQFVLSSKIKWIERDIGHDKLIAVHRTSGVVGLTVILIHPAFLVLYDILRGVSPTFGLPKLIGFVALALFTMAAGTAIFFHRLRLKYETWQVIHRLSYAALPLGFVHSLLIGSDLAVDPLRTFWLILAVLYVAIVVYKLWNIIQVRTPPVPGRGRCAGNLRYLDVTLGGTVPGIQAGSVYARATSEKGGCWNRIPSPSPPARRRTSFLSPLKPLATSRPPSAPGPATARTSMRHTARLAS